MAKNETVDAVELVLKQILEKNSKIDFLDILLMTTDIVAEVEEYGDDAVNHINDICNKIYANYPKYFDIEEKHEEKKPCTCNNAQQPKKECTCQNKKVNTYVSDTETKKVIKILVPGVSKSNIVLSVKDYVLSMKLVDVVIEHPFVNPDMTFEYELDETCDIEKITSTLDAGILTIVIPKFEKKDTTKILKIQ